MNLPLMPKATAVWLIENTTLSFDQIGAFCGMHPLEVQGIADGDVATGILGVDPVAGGQVKLDDIKRGENDPNYRLQMIAKTEEYIIQQRKKKSRYTPIARRQDKPDAIAWIIKNHPEINDAQIAKLIGTTKNTIATIRDRSHWNTSHIRPRDPVLLGLCTQTDLHAAIQKAADVHRKMLERQEKEARKSSKGKKPAQAKSFAADPEAPTPAGGGDEQAA
ncbi:MAG: DUF1013 domain-containing protein [Proteobacteria bacterium]|nr:DUF1013 domain-containing protein [Pseudomonadota bacterium]